MPRRRKNPKPRAKKKPCFPVESWQPLMDFLNDKLKDCWRPYLISLDLPPLMMSYLDDETLLELGVDPESEYFREKDENGFPVTALGRYVFESSEKYACLPAEKIQAYRKKVESEIRRQREMLQEAINAWAGDPGESRQERGILEGRFYGTKAGCNYLKLLEDAVPSGRLHSMQADRYAPKKFLWIKFPHFGYAAVVLIERLRQALEDWRLSKCWCGSYYLKKTKRKQKHCSDECRIEWNNNVKPAKADG